MTRDMRLLFSRAHRTTTRYFQDRAAEQELSIVQAQALMVIDVAKGAGVEKVGIVTEGMRRAGGD